LVAFAVFEVFEVFEAAELASRLEAIFFRAAMRWLAALGVHSVEIESAFHFSGESEKGVQVRCAAR
jgi:hypothetical protein